MGDYCKEGERGPKGSKWLPMESELAKEKHPGALRKSEQRKDSLAYCMITRRQVIAEHKALSHGHGGSSSVEKWCGFRWYCYFTRGKWTMKGKVQLFPHKDTNIKEDKVIILQYDVLITFNKTPLNELKTGICLAYNGKQLTIFHP